MCLVEWTNASPKKFETVQYDITIADAPSHRDFIKSGLTQPARVNCAMLVLSARLGEFETSSSRDGRAREYVLLAYTVTDGTFVQALDAISVPQQAIDTPFRLSVQDVYKIADIDTVVIGRVEVGVLRQNMVVKFA